MMSRATKRRNSSSEQKPTLSITDGWYRFIDNMDTTMLFAVYFLVGVGLVMLYSASSAYALKTFNDSTFFLKRQLLWAALGSIVLVFSFNVPISFLKKRAGWGFIIVTVLCALVLIPGIGAQVGGARRWIRIGMVGFQPSELAKVIIVIVLASILARRSRKNDNTFMSLLIPALFVQIPILLILAGPDLGTAIVIELVILVVLYIAGIKPVHLFMFVLACLPVVYHLVVATPFRLRRILGYIDPWAYRSSVGYQVTEALISIGSGGVTGVGLGAGKQQLFFLPEAHTDFIFAILAEELGLIGVLIVLTAFVVVVWRGAQIAINATDEFSCYLAVGLVALIAVPVIFNLFVVTGLLPTKGLPLTFISSGGSNLLMTLMAVGLLFNIGRTTLSVSKGKR